MQPLQKMTLTRILCLLLLAMAPLGSHAGLTDGEPYEVRVDQRGFMIDGRYRLLRGGALQWFRIPEENWRDRLEKFKAAGFNTLDIYVPWNLIEPREGRFQFEKPDLGRFLDLARELELYVYFRPGPYITNEMDGGGLPGWLMDRTTKKSTKADGRVNLRTDDPDYLRYVRRYFTHLNRFIRPWLASEGGPIILYALENEFNWFTLFHEVDKLFWYEGGPERDLLARTPTRSYFSALKQIARDTGITVPLTTLPGDGKASATGDVPGIIPMPNIYIGLGSEQSERVVYDLLNDMHDPKRHDGVYVDMPSGTTETDRDSNRVKRLLLAGLDATFPFNVAGAQQPGFQNSIVLNANGDNVVGKVFDFSALENILTGFVRPTVGYFHNIIDYGGPISVSGLLRESFHEFRRDNLFFDTVEPYLAPATVARRLRVGEPGPFQIDNPALGAPEDEGRFLYWQEGTEGSAFLEVVNASGQAQPLGLNSIHYRGLSFPRHVPASAPVRTGDLDTQFGTADSSLALVLPVNLPLTESARLRYTTASLLTVRDFNGETLAVFHGAEDSQGEIALDGLEDARITYRDPSFTVHEQAGDRVTVGTAFGAGAIPGYGQLQIKTGDGERLRILVTTTENAGRVWFRKAAGRDIALLGPAYIPPSRSGSDNTLDRLLHNEPGNDRIAVLSNEPLSLTGDYRPVASGPASSGITLLAATSDPGEPRINRQTLDSGRLRSDLAETRPDFDTSGWTRWEGDPRSLERNGIIRGHAWYRAELELTGWNWLPFWEPTDLFVEHASDILGIYVNGTYLTTLAPLGTEIDGNSHNPAYRFPSLRPYLKKGRNVIAFRTEIWGHGSFMWPRGKLTATPVQMPALGFDSEKGLFGEAKLGWRQLENWSVRAGLGGEQKGYMEPGFDDRNWLEGNRPRQLGKGDILWYRSRLSPSDLPDPRYFDAPVVLELKGRNLKAGIYLNGELIGRWISDTGWLERGFWGRAQRDMWMNTSPDHFPLPRRMLQPGDDNLLALVLEDTSSGRESAGTLETLRLRLSEETNGPGYTIKRRLRVE